MAAFEPAPFLVVDTPEQLKAFTDPLRVRVLGILAQREATNQQLADTLGEPHARVLYHVRALVEMGLIRLVDTRIKGGNVEKYYRAVARLFGVRPGPGLAPELAVTKLEAVRQEMAASYAAWPDELAGYESRRARLSPGRAAEFQRRLLDLIAEFWGGPAGPASEDPDAPLRAFAAVTYRDPSDPAAGGAA